MNNCEQIRRYASLIESTLPLPEPFIPESESAAAPALQVERGMILSHLLGGGAIADAGSYLGQLIQSAPASAEHIPEVVDRSGHRRPAYRGLLIYAWAQAFHLGSRPTDESGRGGSPSRSGSAPSPLAAGRSALRAWCKAIESDAAVSVISGSLPASDGAAISSACWSAMALYATGQALAVEPWMIKSRNVFTTLAAAQQSNGALLATSRHDNPETHWYHELVILHAAASYATQANDTVVELAVNRAAEFHLAETQPDHATSQPWGLLAFIGNPLCRPMADELLHNATVQAAGRRSDGVSSILLADVLYCLGLVK